VAAAEALEGQPATLQESIFLNGFVCIMGAGRFKTTGGGQDTGESVLIKSDKAQGEACHRRPYTVSSLAAFSKPARLNNRLTAWSTFLKFASRMGLRAMNIRSQPSLMSPWRSLVASRMRRLARLRTTALPTQRLTEKPKRLCSKSLGKAHRTSKGWVQERPSRRTR
jgi:hypothetical protein